MKTKYIKLYILASLLTVYTALATVDMGHIDSVSHYAKVCHDVSCSSYGNINFLPTQTSTSSPVVITDTAITGYLWGDELGWINLAPTGAGVTVDPNTGILYGTAFSQSSGWINFRPTNGGVTINSNGELVGFAWNGGEYGGWIKFDCAVSASCVKTDWRIISQRPVAPVVIPVVTTTGSLFITPAIIPTVVTPLPTPTPVEKITTVVKDITDTVVEKITEVISPKVNSSVTQNTNTSVSYGSGSGSSIITGNSNSNFPPLNNPSESTNTFFGPNVKNSKVEAKAETNQSVEKKNISTKVIDKIKSSAYTTAVAVESFLVFGWKSLLSIFFSF